MSDEVDRACPLCGRPMVDGPSVNRHHLVPRAYKGRHAEPMHRVCHAKIHAVLTEKQLRDEFSTFETLKAHPEIAAFIRWVARKHPEYVGRHRGSRRQA